ncbi:MAG TPA: ABC transporter permease [Candidatus Avilachnospira avistercoris]|nr:ABC transporter permease [Candidatus Avilachnospira avistercoris]
MNEKRKVKLPISGNQLVLIIAIIGIVIIFSSLNKNYFTYTNLINVLVSSTNIGLTAIGITFLIMTGGNDLSAGSVAAFCGVFTAWALKATSVPWGALVIISLLIAAVAGLLNALMVTKLNIVPFIATLASQSVWRGFAYLLCDGKPVSVGNEGLKNFGTMRIGGEGGVPFPVILMIIFFIIFGYILAKTKFGRSIFAIGGNPEAARLAGINANRIKTICYIMTSVFAGLAGIILASRMSSGQPAASPNLHFDAITAANLGGVSMVGGVGSIPSVALGVILVQAFNSGLNMVGISSYWQYVARGLLLFASLAIDFYRQQSRAKKLLADSMKNL